ncbi:hypothetical protein EZI54_06830 [Marinobacter halodurans]|uniref:Toxin co-regulated pilus biosynthesis protein Q C-terminal domain-containing protein n=1 Tax=Marinobacter halodurans TaxID=2528979 RepID=A0ABY1ZR58_9GAMM|nr:TcpQ domain-containing protein [Marinobacter halodurans]TBW57365.1 hypothetical protein EZI54_06830 [Marinobacter halodurans]
MKKLTLMLTCFSMAMLLAGPATAESVSLEKIDADFPFSPGDRIKAPDHPELEVNEGATFHANAGERLSEVVTRWASMVGYDVVWQPGPDEGDLQLAGSITYPDTTFQEAAKSFFKIIRQQSKFDAQIHPNKVLRVFVTGD